MKDQMLKIAKVKSEKEFYKKYPTEEAFMAKHGAAFKKAAMGKSMVYKQLNQLTDWDNPDKAQDGGNWASYGIPGMSTATYDASSGLVNNASGVVSQADTTALGFTKNAPGAGGFDAAGAGMAAINALPQLISGVEAIGAQKKAQKKAEQATQLSGLALQAQQTMEKPKRKYVRPEDALVQPGQLGNPYGTGTNYLAAENGTRIGGNPTEIQNMYNPGDMYTDLGFEPMGETLKQYKHGGYVHKAELGDYFQDSGQAQVGSAVGSAIGNAILPGVGGAVGSMLGKVAGNLFGGADDANKLAREKEKAAMNTQQAAFAQTQRNQFGAYMKDGGWVSNDWQPQTFTKFGDYSAKELLAPPHDADMLRAGGHLKEYTPPSAEAMFTGRPPLEPLTMNTGGRMKSTNMMFDTDKYPRAQDGVQLAMGGDLQVGDGGHVETMSYNPNLPGGEIGMFRGASHDNGGIQTQYGDNHVEVEGNEPVVKLKDGGSEDNLVVFGNIKINKNIADLMGDPKAKGMKFKTYIADVAKNDAKQLKRINKGLDMIQSSDENSAYDHLKLNTGNAILSGAKAWQKINAEKIKQAGIVQDAIHQTANELGAKSDKLAEGKIEQETDPSMMGQMGYNYKTGKGTGKALADAIVKDALKGVPKGEPEFFKIPYPLGTGGAPELQEVYVASDKKPKAAAAATAASPVAAAADDKEGFDWKGLGQMALSNIAPWLRPSNANEGLPPDQLYPEYFALATNQVEPVKAQTYQPMLDTPYDISLQDQINAVDSQARLAALNAGQNNPAAQAQIMAQALEAKNRILGEQSRINQANKMQVYDKNRALLNDAQLKNLQILDQQYVRQAQAKSNTKAQAQAVLNSIAAKTAQQRAANRKLAVLENMYNFRFSPSGRAYNVNEPAQFDLSGMNARRTGLSSAGLPANKRFTIDSVTGEPVGIRTLTKEEMAGNYPSLSEVDSYLSQKNGGKTSKKNARNSSIVKALKNL